MHLLEHRDVLQTIDSRFGPMRLVGHAQAVWLETVDALSPEQAAAGFKGAVDRAVGVVVEILVAADLVRTVAVEPTLENVAILGLIVLIRTFLSFSLELEIEGRWPWQRKRSEKREV